MPRIGRKAEPSVESNFNPAYESQRRSTHHYGHVGSPNLLIGQKNTIQPIAYESVNHRLEGRVDHRVFSSMPPCAFNPMILQKPKVPQRSLRKLLDGTERRAVGIGYPPPATQGSSRAWHEARCSCPKDNPVPGSCPLAKSFDSCGKFLVRFLGRNASENSMKRRLFAGAQPGHRLVIRGSQPLATDGRTHLAIRLTRSHQHQFATANQMRGKHPPLRARHPD